MEKVYKRKVTKVVCNNCGKTFEKAISEIKRTEKKSGNHYCSLSCNGAGNINNNLGKKRGNLLNFKNKTRKDKYTGLREFLRRAKNRKKLGDLTLDDLLKQWNKQNGTCPYTGINLKLPTYKKNKHNLIELASLDRIDSNKSYEKGNIMFVSTPINYMKNSMTEQETIDYCKIISLFWNNKINMETNKT